MRFVIYSFIIPLVIVSNIVASDVLSNTQTDMLNLTNEKNIQDSSKLKKDLLNPIIYQYSYSNDIDNDRQTKKSSLSINQSIFRFGGIYYALRYSLSLQDLANLNLSIQKKLLLFKTYSLVYNIKKLDIKISQQKNLLSSATIDLKIKKESVFKGLLDISFLNNSLISKNKISSIVIDLEFQKEKLINDLKALSDIDYKKIITPKLEVLSQKDFISHNLSIKKDSLTVKQNDYTKGITNAKYLPNISVNYKTTLNHDTENTTSKYGFTVSVPLDLRIYNDISASRISYLKSKRQLELTKLKERLFLDTQLKSIDNIKDKISLTKHNIIEYNKILDETNELVEAGLKIGDDALVLENTINNEELNIKNYQIDIQLKLLELYKNII